jgi:hypothetical protein
MLKNHLLIGLISLLIVFFVSCGGNENPTNPTPTNNAPGVPTINTTAGAPGNGATDVPLSAVLSWNCTDADGDPLTFTVYFGTTANPPEVSSSQSTESYTPASLAYSTTYYWKIVAKDDHSETSTSPIWSFTVMDQPAAETVSGPAVPSGAATGVENEDLAYTASGSVSSYGDGVEYRFDWGDGSMSDWGTASVQNSWTTAGTYYVKAQARCVTHKSIVSGWSDSLEVSITVLGAETISTPDVPNGFTTGEEGESLNFATTGAVSSDGHAVAYRWDWGDGTISIWTSVATRSYTWNTAGTYEVKVQARCVTHPSIMSNWSGALTVTITVPAVETISPPDAPTAPATGTTGENIVVTNNGGAVSSDGHAVAYRIDFGDGTITSWYNTIASMQHAYLAPGTHDIAMQARCRTHTSIESAWSASTSITISDPAEIIPSTPDTIYGVFEGGINESYDYTVYHSAQTNLGHTVEGRFDWGDGTYSDWIYAAPYSAAHTYTTEGTYTVNYQARCSTHTSITANANPLTVNIYTEAPETISKPGNFSMQTHQRYPTVGETVTYYAYGGASSLGHPTEVMIDWGDGTQSDWVDHAGAVTKFWTAAGTYGLTRQSRCKDHPSILSEWSDPIFVYPRDPETISAPDAPIGPDTGHKYTNLAYTATGAVSSWGHANYLEYRFDWGDGSALTAWSTDTVQTHYYTDFGDYEVKAQARDVFPGHTPPESDWSLPTTVSIIEKITIQYPPDGPDYGGVGETYYFKSWPASSDGYAGHVMEYQFDFGDGTFSSWSTVDSGAHTYTTAGTYYVKVQARCQTHTEVSSGWTNGHDITITSDPESVSTPEIPSVYPTYDPLIVNEEMQVFVTGSFNNHGHPVEYQIDFGDGTISPWTIGTLWGDVYQLTLFHTYTAVGTYDITAKARCSTHTSVESAVSPVRTREVFENIPNIAEAPSGPLTGTVGENLTYTTIGSSSSEGHTLEYSFQYWGYSSMISQSDWSTSLTDDHVFTNPGSVYRVRVAVRCASHTQIISYSPFTEYIVITAK